MEARGDWAGEEGRWVAELLVARDFARALARRLLREEHAAEDVAQEAVAALLARKGSAGEGEGGLRAYLGGVVRRIVRDGRRGAARRTERERLAARPEATPATDTFLSREEWRRRIVFEVELDGRSEVRVNLSPL